MADISKITINNELYQIKDSIGRELINEKISCTTANVKSALGTTGNTTRYLREDGTWSDISAITNAQIDALFS